MNELLQQIETLLEDPNLGAVLVGAIGAGFVVLFGLVIRRMTQGSLHGELPAPDPEDDVLAAEALALGDEADEPEPPAPDVDEAPAPVEAPPEEVAEAPGPATAPETDSQAMQRGLEKTRKGFMARLNGLLFGGRTIDPNLLDELEEILVTSDIGIKTTERLLGDLRGELSRHEIKDAATVQARLREKVGEILTIECPPLPVDGDPSVIMVIGVNGVGKTTTIGKLAARLCRDGKKVVLAAGDTFRAAAVEQLEIWGERSGATVVRGADGADPSSVIFEAIQTAKKEGADVCIADTAGRLHTKVNLMQELKKVRRVMDKAQPGAPHEVMLVLDATTGQNAITQAKQFTAAVTVSSIVLTKLDGTAKGGVVVAISDALRLPVRLIGVGEGVDDMRDFDAATFVEALFCGEDQPRA